MVSTATSIRARGEACADTPNDGVAQRAEEDKINEQAADAARQATMLKLVSTTLSKSTGRLVEAAIKEQIKSQVIPGIGKLVSAAVQEQIGRGIEEGLKEVRSLASLLHDSRKR